MAPPKGNQYGVGHGRPPREGWSNAEVNKLGEDLIEWMQECDEKKVNIVHLSEWYSYIRFIRPKDWDALQKRECFLPYYERAMRWMGNRLLKNQKLSPTYGSRFLGIYFKDVRDHEKELIKEKLDADLKKIDHEYEKKNQIAQKFDPDVLDKFNAFLSQLDSLQSQQPVCSDPESSINIDK